MFISVLYELNLSHFKMHVSISSPMFLMPHAHFLITPIYKFVLLLVFEFSLEVFNSSITTRNLDCANDFLSPSVNSRAELVALPSVYAQNGAPRRWLGD